LLERGLVSRQERIGIIGGTFDPVHYGHLAIAEEVYHELHLDRMVFVPAGQPPHKSARQITPARQRLAMLRLALASNAHFTLSLVDMQRSGPSYTVDTLRFLRQEWGPDAELYFVIGGDSLKDLPEWRDPEGILAQATIVALMRPGYVDLDHARELLEARLPDLRQRLITLAGPAMEISSTGLRERVAQGRPITYQTPESVEHYIFQQGLYHRTPAVSLPEQQQDDVHATNAV
jgi:nicotinate-nucleotide adenylyltransferase